ncbi:glycosyltransferase involved in cell wall biosynthesis [Lederbergia galactosidilyticus]|uniref:glycosyltransferase n=1 Tax=Lederbergia galactosidilytica TaxID=217031 RepID=UPI001AEB15CA|nr:glycosyltransferase [Lederbergia galactosidilytica]MBP1915423.1 glycosyltransferase involved in cell wall biosynthesis [Lederbergia galactosidilytica]
MKILHLCSYYTGNKLYSKLFSELTSYIDKQTIYIPIRSQELLNKNKVELQKLEYHYDLILNKYDRFLYRGKIKKQQRRIEKNIPSFKSFDTIHAHTLFSDGGTAYLLNQKYGINYVVSIRNTDIHVFYKYGIHLRPFIFKVLENASSIVFISHAYQKKTFDLLPTKIVELIKDKTQVIPNGIDKNWFNSLPDVKNEPSKKLRLLFTGSLDKNKNLSSVLKLGKLLMSENVDFILNVAGDGPLCEQYRLKTKQMGLDNRVKFHGNISKDELICIADNSDVFILPSYKETFGISYIEAMSRGLPIIYTRNEGIDGYFPEGRVGYSIDPDDIIEMKDRLNLIVEDFTALSKNSIIEARKFNWQDIALKYFELHTHIEQKI